MQFAAPLWIFPVLPLVLLVLCAAAVYWALSQMAPLGNTPVLRAPRPTFAADSAALESLLAAPVSEDLTIVEGIGPKIAGVLRAGGITSLGALAASDPASIQQILRAAGMNLASPETWPEQARLAAAGRAEELKALQESLRAGRSA